MMQSVFCRVVVAVITASLLSAGFASTASAALITTEEAVALSQRAERLDRLESFLAREDVADQLQRLGVEPSLAAERAAALSDAELAALDGNIREAVAGGDVLAVLGIVFIVLLVLELVGVTDVFSRM